MTINVLNLENIFCIDLGKISKVLSFIPNYWLSDHILFAEVYFYWAKNYKCDDKTEVENAHDPAEKWLVSAALFVEI